MTIFFSPNSDVILSALGIALLWTGVNCIALAREKSIARPVPSWLCLGIAMLVLAVRESLGTFAIPGPALSAWYPVAAVLQVVSGLFVLHAAWREAAPRSAAALSVHAAAGVLLLVLAGIVAMPLFAGPGGGGTLITAALFLLAKISLCAVCAMLLFHSVHSGRPLPGAFQLALALVFLHAISIAFCNPPGTPAGPGEFGASTDGAMLGVWNFRVVVAYSMALLTWHIRSRSIGVSGAGRWWPAMILGLMIATFFVFVRLAAHSHPAAMSGKGPVETALALYEFKRPFLLGFPPAFLLALLLLGRQQRSWLASPSRTRAEALRAGMLSNDLAGVMITTGPGLGSRVVDANQRLLDMLGMRRDDLVGRSAGAAFTLSPSGPPGGAEAAAGGAAQMEVSFPRPGGGTAHLMVFARPLSADEAGGAHIWESVDVTRIREMEREVRRSNDRLQMVLDTLPDAVFLKDAAGRYTMVNKAFCALFSLGGEADVVGRTLEEISGIDPGNVSVNDGICRDMRGKTLVYDQALTFGGAARFFEVSKTMRWIGGDEGDFVIVGGVHDLTQRKRAENAIDAERHFLRQVLNTLPVAVCFVDRERIVRICDTDFGREAGFGDAGDAIGRPFDDVSPFGPSDREEDERLLAAGEGRNDSALELPSGGGRAAARHFMLRRTVMRSPGGDVLGLVKAYWDTTALVSANRAAQQAERAKTAFLANMSHELRTPMNGIVGMADLIIDHRATEPMQRLHAETIIRSAKTLQMVMDEVMDVATLKDGAHRFEVRPAPFPLLQLAEETAQVVSCIIEAWGAELSLGYDFSLGATHHGDARHVRQILVQILTHTSRLARDRRLRLEIAGAGSLEDGRVALRVVFKPADGVDARRVEDMFKHPRQAGEDTRSAIDLGIFNDRIGLPLTWRLIQAMGGSLSVARQFRDIRCEVVLPLGGHGEGRHPIAAPDLSGARVLVGTNVPERPLAARKCYDYARAGVTLAETADALLARLIAAREAGTPFDLVFLDAGLAAGPDGIPALVSEVWKAHGDAKGGPAIMLAVSSRQVQGLQLDPAAAKCLLLPPVCPSELWCKSEMLIGLGGGALPDPSGLRRRSTRVERIMKIHARVLLVEDNSVNQMVAMGILKRLGCQAVLAKDGAEAVDMIARQGLDFDLLLMDCMMPVMDGYEATMRIRLHEKSGSGSKRNTIVALTANSLAGDRERCLASGMDDYMTKPVTLDQLRDCLVRHCPRAVSLIDTSGGGAGAASGEAAG